MLLFAIETNESIYMDFALNLIILIYFGFELQSKREGKFKMIFKVFKLFCKLYKMHLIKEILNENNSFKVVKK